MKATLCTVVSIGIITIMTGAVQAGDLENGFGNIAWATPLEAVENCQKVEDREDIHYCLPRNQVHTLFGESIPEVLYGFYQEAFYSVFIRIEDDKAYMETKGRLIARLGTPETSLNKDGIVSTLRWTDGKARVQLYNDHSKEGFQLVFYYIPIAEKAFSKKKIPFPYRWKKINLVHGPSEEATEVIQILQF